MNYYPHHIGDYLTATAHLSWLEDAAYRRLLDLYYSREQALPEDIAQACRLVRAQGDDERAAVATVLHEFFDLGAEGWTHSRCDGEIERARAAAERARINGRKGGRPRKTSPTPTDPVTPGLWDALDPPAQGMAPNPNPNPKSQTDAVPGGTAAAPRAEAPSDTAAERIFALGLPLLMSAAVPERQARAMLGLFRKHHPDAEVLRAIQRCADAQAIEPVAFLQRLLRPAPPGDARAQQGRSPGAAWQSELRDLVRAAPTEIDMGVIDATPALRA
ncbi:YdaU family protein [Bordetella genomosp. 1]|uniref:DUF1376 domain-containing protein n=1 Tax=Bordetella genomosp. 1 TaxID=1395607 RepID=A0ABX4EUF8_9BORD|nr:YdaU family protein [Bordetella genomosp. 1]OZI57880.1 hypothetical protein CAL27_21005 [Bordetella genomosp. 1]